MAQLVTRTVNHDADIWRPIERDLRRQGGAYARVLRADSDVPASLRWSRTQR